MTAMEQMGQKARQAARELNAVSGTQKNAALEAMASSLEEQTGAVLEAVSYTHLDVYKRQGEGGRGDAPLFSYLRMPKSAFCP